MDKAAASVQFMSRVGAGAPRPPHRRVSVVARPGSRRRPRLETETSSLRQPNRETDERCMQPMHAIQAFATSFTSTEFPGCTRRPGRSCCTMLPAVETSQGSSADHLWSATAQIGLAGRQSSAGNPPCIRLHLREAMQCPTLPGVAQRRPLSVCRRGLSAANPREAGG